MRELSWADSGGQCEYNVSKILSEERGMRFKSILGRVGVVVLPG